MNYIISFTYQLQNIFALTPSLNTASVDASSAQVSCAAKISLEGKDSNDHFVLTTSNSILNINGNSQNGSSDGIIMAQIAGVEVSFLIDSGAEVNTVGSDTFEKLQKDNSTRIHLFCVKEGSDKPLRAYAMREDIRVVATLWRNCLSVTTALDIWRNFMLLRMHVRY